ncbi:MAG: hypothetical protein U0521_26145 [Anaerolineae bacterium]
MTVATALHAHVAIPLAVLAGIGVGVLAGLINGLLITRVRINPFITTLGMMGIARGVSLAVTEGTIVAGLPQEYFVYGQRQNA